MVILDTVECIREVNPWDIASAPSSLTYHPQTDSYNNNNKVETSKAAAWLKSVTATPPPAVHHTRSQSVGTPTRDPFDADWASLSNKSQVNPNNPFLSPDNTTVKTFEYHM